MALSPPPFEASSQGGRKTRGVQSGYRVTAAARVKHFKWVIALI